MKKRYSLIFTFTAAAVLVSSIAYASKKKLQSKSEQKNLDISEVDLATNLMDSGMSKQRKQSKEHIIKKQTDIDLEEITMLEKPKSLDKIICK